jgi:AbrB family looped-hinge helix DNA binding protein
MRVDHSAKTTRKGVLGLELAPAGARRRHSGVRRRLATMIYGRFYGMTSTIQMDASGRLVLPKAVRERLNLRRGARLRAEVVAGHIELIPVGTTGADVVAQKRGILVLKRTGNKADAATAVAAERKDQEARGLRR